MRSVRLILAGAASVSARPSGGDTEAAPKSAAVAGFLRPFGFCRGGLVAQTDAQLLLDFNEFFWIGFKVARVRPLEFGFQLATDFPVNIAEMIVDGRVLRPQFDRALQMFGRFLVIPNAV